MLLAKLEAFERYELDAVNGAAALYGEVLAGSGLVLPEVPEGFRSSWAQYTVQLPEGLDRDALQARLKDQDVPTMVYYPKPMHGRRRSRCAPVLRRLPRDEAPLRDGAEPADGAVPEAGGLGGGLFDA